MDIIVWMLTGGIVGWAGYAFLGFNEARGMNVSIVIGALGALVGGKMIAPMFTATAAVSGDFTLPALFFAAAVAAAFLAVGNLVYNRWGV
jgi:uncharacterized membrane protein YeaQ/YmgE (transglycosylase-associated protein family)